MIVRAVPTAVIDRQSGDIQDVLDRHVDAFVDGSILAVASKIVSICQGRLVKVGESQKEELVRQESELFIPGDRNRYGVALTIAHNMLIPSAGIDESNGNGHYVLWPETPQAVANSLRMYLCRRFALINVGVIITDSCPQPLRWGVTGVSLAHSGFRALNDYVGTNDLFGRAMEMTRTNVAQALAAAAVVVMGEGSEQTPLAVINDVPFVEFQSRDPSAEELDHMSISIEDDLFRPLLGAVAWEKGDARRDPGRQRLRMKES